jgi:hypothetical protein
MLEGEQLQNKYYAEEIVHGLVHLVTRRVECQAWLDTDTRLDLPHPCLANNSSCLCRELGQSRPEFASTEHIQRRRSPNRTGHSRNRWHSACPDWTGTLSNDRQT